MSSDDDPPEPAPRPAATTVPASSTAIAVVLAAGRGQRLQSALPKPIVPVCGRAMAAHVLHAVAEAGVHDAVVVIPPGERGQQIASVLQADAPAISLRFAVQASPRGTADALLSAHRAVLQAQDAHERDAAHVLVVNADLALLSAAQVRPLLALSEPAVDAAIATATVPDAAKMGRILRDEHGQLLRIVEYRDATDQQRRIAEVNLGVYLFRCDFLWPHLERIVRDADGEAYATDVIADAVSRGSAATQAVALPNGRLNVETPADVADAEAVVRRRIVEQLLASGVHIRDRQAVWLDATVEIEPSAMIEPGTHIRGRSRIAAGARIGPNAIIESAQIGPGCALESCTVQESELAAEVEVGPYSTIRAGCQIGPGAHIGTHAELKRAQIGEAVQIGHFSYVGDAIVGARSNIGAGAITCNFDGALKHETIIGADAFIGSDSLLVAPIRIGDRARTGAGAVVTKDVPDDGNAVGHPARLTPSRRVGGPESAAHER